MKNRICLIVLITILSVSCKKEFKTQPVDQVVVLLKDDIEMKELYTASKSWVIMTSIDVSKRRFDSAATVSYLQNFKSTEQERLLKLAENIKVRYKFHLYSDAQKKAMISETFKSYINTEKVRSQKQPEMARFEDPTQPTDILYPPAPRNCYKWLIEDVSNCDEEMVIESGFALFGVFRGVLTYFVTQTIAFIRHSRCVDNAHEAYRRCMSKTMLAVVPEDSQIGDGIFQIRNPENSEDFIIIYQGTQ